MQNYIEMAEIYWEIGGLYKDLLVEYFLDEAEKICQNCAGGSCYVFVKDNKE